MVRFIDSVYRTHEPHKRKVVSLKDLLEGKAQGRTNEKQAISMAGNHIQGIQFNLRRSAAVPTNSSRREVRERLPYRIGSCGISGIDWRRR
jgi:hypothetical protein